MSKRFRRFNYKSIKEEEDDKDKKDIKSFTSKDGSVTIVKEEKIHRNYRFNKIIRNDEDAKIIQDFCRLKMRPIMEKIKEENEKKIQKEQEETQNDTNNLKRGDFSRYKRKLMNEQESSNANKSLVTQNNQNNNEVYISKKMNENTGEDKRNNQTDENIEESNNGTILHRRRFQNSLQNSNENISSEKVKNEVGESNLIRYKRKKNFSEKKEQKEERPKFVPTYHEKKKVEYNSSLLNNRNNTIDKNYTYQVFEVIPVKLCSDDNEYPRMRIYSPEKTQYVVPYLNPDFIITEIKFEENYIPQSNIGYSRGFNNNINYYKQNLSRNESFYRNQNLYGRQIVRNQYKNENKYTRPFTNANISGNQVYKIERKQNSQLNNHELKVSYASGYN